MGWCEWYEPLPGSDQVVSDMHLADDGVHFFVPVKGGGAVRAQVCHEHADMLQARYNT
jgi:hypothetical protein